jgi:hypothetical protein
MVGLPECFTLYQRRVLETACKNLNHHLRYGFGKRRYVELRRSFSTHLGPGRVYGNKPDACFSRQVSMYLAKHVGGWSTPKIGRFYGGRHHTSVRHAIRKIDRCRRSDQSIEALMQVLGAALIEDTDSQTQEADITKWPRDNC